MNKPAFNIVPTEHRLHTPRSIEFTQNAGTLDANADEAWRLAKSVPVAASEQARIADAELQTRVWCNPGLVVEQQDQFFAKYGVRRGDDNRPAGDLAEASRKWDEEHARLSADHRAAYAKFGIVAK